MTKPSRPPDAVVKPGHAFWWEEMVFMHVYGGLYKVEVDQQDNSLFYESHMGIKTRFAPSVRQLYDEWWYETFESKFLGDV